MVTAVPPAVVEMPGETEDTVGAGTTKVNWSLAVIDDVPPGVVTRTSTVPPDSAGEVAVICVGPFTV